MSLKLLIYWLEFGYNKLYKQEKDHLKPKSILKDRSKHLAANVLISKQIIHFCCLKSLRMFFLLLILLNYNI